MKKTAAKFLIIAVLAFVLSVPAVSFAGWRGNGQRGYYRGSGVIFLGPAPMVYAPMIRFRPVYVVQPTYVQQTDTSSNATSSNATSAIVNNQVNNQEVNVDVSCPSSSTASVSQGHARCKPDSSHKERKSMPDRCKKYENNPAAHKSCADAYAAGRQKAQQTLEEKARICGETGRCD